MNTSHVQIYFSGSTCSKFDFIFLSKFMPIMTCFFIIESEAFWKTRWMKRRKNISFKKRDSVFRKYILIMFLCVQTKNPRAISVRGVHYHSTRPRCQRETFSTSAAHSVLPSSRWGGSSTFKVKDCILSTD